MTTFRVTISRKPGLSDPEGATTQRALADLGFDTVDHVQLRSHDHARRSTTTMLEAATAQVDRDVRQAARQPGDGVVHHRGRHVRVAVVVFPGTNCEHDIVHALDLAGAESPTSSGTATPTSPERTLSCSRRGFAHGDYLRTGAIARFSPVMAEVERIADDGRPVLGICNGFQILCEAGLLPGALVANRDLKFICKPDPSPCRVDRQRAHPSSSRRGQVLEIPLNSYEGNYIATEPDAVESAGHVILRYCGRRRRCHRRDWNPNGSTNWHRGDHQRRRQRRRADAPPRAGHARRSSDPPTAWS